MYDGRSEGISLYVHVPFCLSKCPYCDFNTYQGIESQFDDYREAVTSELEAWGRALGHPPVNTIFLGGGTPSYLPTGDIGQILDGIAEAYPVREGAEVTAECNPNDLTAAKCVELRAAGGKSHQHGRPKHGQWPVGAARTSARCYGGHRRAERLPPGWIRQREFGPDVWVASPVAGAMARHGGADDYAGSGAHLHVFPDPGGRHATEALGPTGSLAGA